MYANIIPSIAECYLRSAFRVDWLTSSMASKHISKNERLKFLYKAYPTLTLNSKEVK